MPVGYSDHTIGNTACLAAVAMGACIIEKHFALEKSVWKSEIELSLNPKNFSKMVQEIRKIEKAIGKPQIGITDSEKQSRKNMRYSLAATKNIKSGTKIKKSLLTFLRPGTGISPNMIDKIAGLIINQNVSEGQLLQWNMFYE